MRDRRLLGDDLLEATLEGGVLFEVLAELVEGGGANGLQFATGEHRLQNRRRVDRALGGTRSDEGVDLIDEEDDVAAGLDLEHLLETLLEVAAVARTGDEGAEVERVELLVVEGFDESLAIAWARPSRSPSCRHPAHRRGPGYSWCGG